MRLALLYLLQAFTSSVLACASLNMTLSQEALTEQETQFEVWLEEKINKSDSIAILEIQSIEHVILDSSPADKIYYSVKNGWGLHISQTFNEIRLSDQVGGRCPREPKSEIGSKYLVFMNSGKPTLWWSADGKGYSKVISILQERNWPRW